MPGLFIVWERDDDPCCRCQLAVHGAGDCDHAIQAREVIRCTIAVSAGTGSEFQLRIGYLVSCLDRNADITTQA